MNFFCLQEDKPCGEDYGGPFAKSELETRHIMKNYRANAPILGSLDVHSYGQLLLRPWGHTNVTAPDDKYHADIGRQMVQLIKKVSHMMSHVKSHDYNYVACPGEWYAVYIRDFSRPLPLLWHSDGLVSTDMTPIFS